MATIIDGKESAARVKAKVAERVEELGREGRDVGLAVVLVGDDQASATYVAAKHRDCAECGITSYDHKLPADTSQEDLDELISELNADPAVNGILVQMPLPRGLDEERVISLISPEKDADGFHPENMGRLVRGLRAPRACTPAGVMRLLEDHDIDPTGKNAVVIGRSNIVGKPMALMLLEADATVTICHSRTQDLAHIVKQADIVVSAVGIVDMVTADMVKPGAVVIDVGMNRDDEDKLVGDVDYEPVAEVASAITPVPGGVGPMTRALLMKNTLEAALSQYGLE